MDLIQPWTGAPFSGAKIVLHHRDGLLTHLRDDIPTIPWRNRWDLPGGGREGDEDPLTCALREAREEYGLTIPPARVTWLRGYAPVQPGGLPGWFAAAPITDAERAAVRFGDEGQRWDWMPFATFLAHPQAIPHLQDRLRDWLAATAPQFLAAVTRG